MPEQHTREVVIRLILDVDKGKGAQAGAEMRKVLDSAKTQATAAAKATADVTTKAADQQVKAIKKVAAEQEKATRATRQNQAALNNAFKQSAAGAMLLGRSLAMLGVMGEKDLEKVVRALVKIQMIFDSLKGAGQVIQGISNAAAVRGATGAAGAGGAGAAGVGGTAVAASASPIVVGVAAAAASLLALASVVTFTKDAFKYGVGGGGAPGGFQETVGTSIKDFGKWAMSFSRTFEDLTAQLPTWVPGPMGAAAREMGAERRTERMGTAQEQRRASEAALPGMFARQAALEQQMMAGRDPLSLGRARGAMGRARGGMEAARGMREGEGLAEPILLEAERRYGAAIQDVIKLLEKKRDISVAASRTELAGIEKVTEAARRQSEVHLGAMAAIVKATGRTTAAFGRLSPQEQERALRAGRAVKRGDATMGQIEIAQRWGVAGGEIQQKAQGELWRRTSETDFGDVYGKGYIAAGEREARGGREDIGRMAQGILDSWDAQKAGHESARMFGDEIKSLMKTYHETLQRGLAEQMSQVKTEIRTAINRHAFDERGQRAALHYGH